MSTIAAGTTTTTALVNTGDTTGNLVFQTNGTTTAMTIDTSQNLGLGVTPSAWGSDTRALQIFNRTSLSDLQSTTQLTNNGIWNGTNWVYRETAAAGNYNINSGAHIWRTATSGTAGNAITFTQTMTLDPSGNLGIGTTSPTALGAGRTSVNINGSTDSVLWMMSNSVAIGYLQAVSTSFNIVGTTNQNVITTAQGTGVISWITGAAERARINSSGNLLVGTAADSGARIRSYFDGSTVAYGMRIGMTNTTGTAIQFVYEPSAQVGTITMTTSATAYNTSSDYRLKDNPQPLTGSGAFIDALKPKTWQWKVDGSRGVGFIAHEVQEVSPSSVVGEKDGEQMQAMEYGSAEFIANIIAELQTLRARVAALEGAK